MYGKTQQLTAHDSQNVGCRGGLWQAVHTVQSRHAACSEPGLRVQNQGCMCATPAIQEYLGFRVYLILKSILVIHSEIFYRCHLGDPTLSFSPHMGSQLKKLGPATSI